MRRMQRAAVSELRDRESTDPVVASAADSARRVLSLISQPPKVASVELVVADFSGASEQLLGSLYFTPLACSFPQESLIIINAELIKELDSTVRAFEQYPILAHTPYLAGDEQMFKLARAARSGAEAQEMRQGPAMSQRAAVRQVELAVRFIVGHELGHILRGGEGGDFRSLPGLDTPAEQRIELAVTKLGRHVDDLGRHGFDLPLWEGMTAPSSPMRRTEQSYAERLGHEYVNQSIWFADEEKADTWAEDLLRASLVAARSDPIAAHYERYLMCKALFALAIGCWYRDMLQLGEMLNWEEPLTHSALMAALFTDRENYVRLAALFGEIHRLPLLRAWHAIKRLFEAMPVELWVSPEDRALKYTGGWPPTTPRDEKAWLCSESLRRFWLLAMLMDTPIKIATVGMTMGWYREQIEAGDMRQMLFVNFEDISQAWARVLQMD
jgi:hypothetical protein